MLLHSDCVGQVRQWCFGYKHRSSCVAVVVIVQRLSVIDKMHEPSKTVAFKFLSSWAAGISMVMKVKILCWQLSGCACATVYRSTIIFGIQQ